MILRRHDSADDLKLSENLKLSLAEPLIRPLVPLGSRGKSDAFWTLVDHLLEVTSRGSEPALRQIRLAWWRDALMALDTGHVPADPTLLKVRSALVPRHSGAALAEIADTLIDAIGSGWDADAVMLFGQRVFSQSGKMMSARAEAGQAWACARIALLIEPGMQSPLWTVARKVEVERGPARSLRALDRLSRSIARRHGERRRGAEQLLVLRVGLVGR